MSPASAPIRRPRPGEIADYYAGYVALVPDGDVLHELEAGLAETQRMLGHLDDHGAEHRYAEGKWSIKDLVGHLIDAERVFSYRALRIARGDATPLPGFDQDAYVAAADFDGRTLEGLLRELALLRAADLLLFRSFSDREWDRCGTASDAPFVACAFPWILAGHERHHQRVLAERYL